MKKFKEMGLHIKYKKEIAEWFRYLDQQKFSRKLEKQMLEEINRYMADKETIEELMERIFIKPEWEIEFLSQNPDTKIFIEVLGYA